MTRPRQPLRMKAKQGRPEGKIPIQFAEGAKAILDYLKPQLNELSQVALADMGADTSPAIATDWLQFTGRRPEPGAPGNSSGDAPKPSRDSRPMAGDDRPLDIDD